jgi:quinol monooxygenase YgiN
MYGSLITYKPKPEARGSFTDLARDWANRRGVAAGLVVEYVLEPEDQPDAVHVLAVFASREAYRANAADPVMDAEYRTLRTLLTADPTFFDGEITAIEASVVPL